MDSDSIKEMNYLSERQQKCLLLRLSNKTYKEIGKEINTCGSRAWQILAKIKRKLRYPAVIKSTEGLSLKLLKEIERNERHGTDNIKNI